VITDGAIYLRWALPAGRRRMLFCDANKDDELAKSRKWRWLSKKFDMQGVVHPKGTSFGAHFCE
jgi:hypothetical protein